MTLEWQEDADWIEPAECNGGPEDDGATLVRMTCFTATGRRGNYRVLQTPVYDLGADMQPTLMDAGVGTWKTYFWSHDKIGDHPWSLAVRIESWWSDTCADAKALAEGFDGG